MSVSESGSLSTIAGNANPTRPTLLCPTSQKYAFSRDNRTSARIIFVGDQQETAMHLLASTCTDGCPLLAQSGHAS